MLARRRSFAFGVRNADRFAYNRRGEVVFTAYSNGTLVVSNRYDHLGRRVQKIAPDGTHTFLYDGWRPVVETVAKPSGGTDRIEYHWGKALAIWMVEMLPAEGYMFVIMHVQGGQIHGQMDIDGGVPGDRRDRLRGRGR